MVFENGVKNIQAAAYNGARTVSQIILKTKFWVMLRISLASKISTESVWTNIRVNLEATDEALAEARAQKVHQCRS